MEMLVERAVTEALRDEGDEAFRPYAAACAERMAPVFVGLRAGGRAGREADLYFYAESVRDLWHADRPLATPPRACANCSGSQSFSRSAFRGPHRI
ncbi:hypothetical protein ACFXDO_33545 [Streptomyces nigra]|uniref:hypothetical protein n=1 Tax=Streptomyces nigra TaxID=1827580 RepID=UPI0036811712